MLTTEDKEEIKRIIVETFATSRRSLPREDQGPDEVGRLGTLLNVVAQMHDLIVNEGFTELTLINPRTGERRMVEANPVPDSIVDVTARAIDVFGTPQKALRWLKTPVGSLGDQTPLSLLTSAEGIAQVQDTLGRVEHGVW